MTCSAVDENMSETVPIIKCSFKDEASIQPHPA